MREDRQSLAFDMVERILKIDIKIVTDFENYHIFDKNSYRFLSMNQIEENFRNILCSQALSDMAGSGTYYIIRTSLEISMAAVPLREKSGAILMGPYLSEGFSEQTLEKIWKENRVPASSMGALKTLYTTIPTAPQNQVEDVAYLIARHVLEYREPIKKEKFLNFQSGLMKDPRPTESFRLASQVLEERYGTENRFLSAIRRGDQETAMRMLKNWPSKTVLPRPRDPLRSQKDLLLSGNTLYRKAAEAGDVHPIYLDYISRKFALRIEECASLHRMEAIHRDMVQEYCALVHKYSLSRYSRPVQKAMNHIQLNLMEDLTLKSVAGKIDLAPSYLSGLFKKEAGMTITAYIHAARLSSAAELLISTDASVSEAAERSGINDASYFCHLFRQQYGMTPSEYRRKHLE